MDSVVERVISHAKQTLPDRADLDSCLSQYFAHVDKSDLVERRVTDLFGMALDHLQLGANWQPGTVAIQVVNPRLDTDGWESDHTVVQIVADDIPFLVDSTTMELSRLGVGIHLVVHPILCRQADSGTFEAASDESSNRVSFISVEIDRQNSDSERELVERELQRVLHDVRAAVRDWPSMRDRMREVSKELADAVIPIEDDDKAETQFLLDWLADDHFIFLGARDYELGTEDGVEVLRIVDNSGLGILSSNKHLGRPRPISGLPSAARERIHEKRLLNLTKASSRATVHRASYLDYIGIKTFTDDGEVLGERRFLGLFTSEVYNHSVDYVPRARKTVAAVLNKTGYPAGGHDEKRLQSVLESYPRDDLLQMDPDELLEVANAITGLQERRRVRVFARQELFGRFVTVLVYLPRDRYNTSIRTGIEEILLASYGGSLADWDAQMSESVLARLRFVLHLDPESTGIDTDTETEIESLIQVWDDDFAEALVHQFGEHRARELGRIYGNAFGLDYQRAYDPRAAAADIEHLEALSESDSLRINAYREPGHATSSFKLKLYRCGERVSLSAVMPSLTNLGVNVVDERPYEVSPSGAEKVWIYDFALEHQTSDLDFGVASELIEDAFGSAWNRTIEDDGFNRLVLCAGMAASDVAILRAYARYLRQVGLPYSKIFVEQTLEAHPDIVKKLLSLFKARFDPDLNGDRSLEGLDADIEACIESIESLDQDRILRRFHNLISSTLRTTWGQRDSAGKARPYIGFKLDPTTIDEMPEPRPRFEIFVYSPRFEGVHLRGGPVARGGLRWSDRTEDYRTEVLGLVKAQMVKNSVIVPGGAKGGFVLKQRPADQAQLREEVVSCYQLFVTALLDLTDNLVDGSVVPPERTVRYDGDDTYLVVAADKGTATFSDVANQIAQDRGFWLGDAFASGGSNGYDHKQMGITARGAWESVKGHFRELGMDIQSEPFTAVGVGDMSGDVFGNGMLLSAVTRLVAAFDHRHIFIDPDPDPATSHVERQRLFDTPRSSWADYNPDLLSAGGGVFERSAKSISLSEEARAALGTELRLATPDQLMSAVLCAPVDLFWNGGIGTYIKAHDESHAEVGDKATDRIRVDGRDLRCSVVGEGGNLGATQKGRIEFALSGGRVYTDAIDNVGGVDCSDHEVNIKILLDKVVANGDMTSKQRNELLEEMTEEVTDLVLESNYRQSLALSAARIDAVSLVDVHARYISEMEQQGLLDRTLESLPDSDAMADRRSSGIGLTTPELAVLKAYTKNTLKGPLLDSDVPDDEALTPLLVNYFPSHLRKQFESEISAHQLKREIISNRLANLVVDRAGVSMIYRLSQETSAPHTEIAAAHYAAWEIFDLESVVKSVRDLGDSISIERRLAIHLDCRQLAERATRLLIRNRPHPFSIEASVEDLGDSVAETIAGMSEHLLGTDRDTYLSNVANQTADGVPEDLAMRAAGLAQSLDALDIVTVAGECGEDLDETAAIHFAVADRLDLTWLRDRILALPRDTQWSTLARLTLRTDLYADHRQLTSLVASRPSSDDDAMSRVDGWIDDHASAIDTYRSTMDEIRTAPVDVTVLLVAAREVRNLIGRSGSSASTVNA